MFEMQRLQRNTSIAVVMPVGASRDVVTERSLSSSPDCLSYFLYSNHVKHHFYEENVSLPMLADFPIMSVSCF